MSEFTAIAPEASGFDHSDGQAELLANDTRQQMIEHYRNAYEALIACPDYAERSFHLDAFDALADCLDEHQRNNELTVRVSLTWPPAAGKTYFAVRSMEMLGAGKEMTPDTPARKWLYVTHETVLHDQLTAVTDEVAPQLRVADGSGEDWDIMPLTMQKLAIEYQKYQAGESTEIPFGDVDIIFDEPDCYALGETNRPIIEDLQQNRITMALTATPEIASGASTYDLWPDVIGNISMRDAIEVYGISPTTLIYRIKTGQVINVENLAHKADVSDEELEALAENEVLRAQTLRIAQTLAGHNVPTMIFGFTGNESEHPRDVAVALNGVKIFDRKTGETRLLSARAIGRFSSVNEHTLAAMRDGNLDVMTTARMGQSGLNIDRIRAVMMVRPSISPRVVAQQAGRAGRLDPTNSDAPRVIIYFDCDMYDELGRSAPLVTPFDIYDVAPSDDGPVVITRNASMQGMSELQREGGIRLVSAPIPPRSPVENLQGRDFRRPTLRPVHDSTLPSADTSLAQRQAPKAPEDPWQAMLDELRELAYATPITVAERTRHTRATQPAFPDDRWDAHEVAKLVGDIDGSYIVKVLQKYQRENPREADDFVRSITVNGVRRHALSDGAMEWLDENIAGRDESTVADMADYFNTSHGAIKRALGKAIMNSDDVATKYRRQFRAGALRQPYYTKAVRDRVADELVEPITDAEISVHDIHEETGLSYDTIHRRFANLPAPAQPVTRRLPQGRGSAYPRQAYEAVLRAESEVKEWSDDEGLVTTITLARRLKHYGASSADIADKARAFGFDVMLRRNGTRTASCIRQADVVHFNEQYKASLPAQSAEKIAEDLQVPQSFVYERAIDHVSPKIEVTSGHMPTAAFLIEQAGPLIKALPNTSWLAIRRQIYTAIDVLKIPRPPKGQVLSGRDLDRVHARMVMMAERVLNDDIISPAVQRTLKEHEAAQAAHEEARRTNNHQPVIEVYKR